MPSLTLAGPARADPGIPGDAWTAGTPVQVLDVGAARGPWSTGIGGRVARVSLARTCPNPCRFPGDGPKGTYAASKTDRCWRAAAVSFGAARETDQRGGGSVRQVSDQ